MDWIVYFALGLVGGLIAGYNLARIRQVNSESMLVSVAIEVETLLARIDATDKVDTPEATQLGADASLTLIESTLPRLSRALSAHRPSKYRASR